MRKADRLFQIIQILRRFKYPQTASRIAEELEVSKRTVYRDIADLIGQRVPIEGEAGTGYILHNDYDMPPLMFNHEELEALILGMSFAKMLPDTAMSTAAEDVLSKVKLVVPKELVDAIESEYVRIKPKLTENLKFNTRVYREAIRAKRKLHITYLDHIETHSERVIWPIFVGYDDRHCLVVAWCELRNQFRSFRVDRIVSCMMLANPIPRSLAQLRSEWLSYREQCLYS
ncbi:YafY family transcriptional regulator [Vibrio fluvialis]|uniref:helix-turn-helix transcriptional regulator n=1 Tax=Vibrio fluvialis TaxID=676 RepID=UPI001C9CCCCB|nr:YafY family protein [Vibrio fluvialis]EKO3386303.1 YafY family transcriptional regulator [Vibrio fluvialis]ELC0657915.1 YafY family transcriptional regulator [Vibrio fluvialis]ELD1799217.1 YafY family transcriptional regulator [Vibrio fluvialis]ELU8400421.1 YafY family transcriptional regulator [Vibrio fluvialis]MBY7934589.1 YafY family transcriptional regulator [Vibrio fluvialis]